MDIIVANHYLTATTPKIPTRYELNKFDRSHRFGCFGENASSIVSSTGHKTKRFNGFWSINKFGVVKPVGSGEDHAYHHEQQQRGQDDGVDAGQQQYHLGKPNQ